MSSGLANSGILFNDLHFTKTMMRAPFVLQFVCAFLLLLVSTQAKPNLALVDSLKGELANCTDDTLCLKMIHGIGQVYFRPAPDSALRYFQMGLERAEATGQGYHKAKMLFSLGRIYFRGFNDTVSFDYLQQSMAAFKAIHDTVGISYCLQNLGLQKIDAGQKEAGIAYVRQAIELAEKVKAHRTLINGYNALAVQDMQAGRYLIALEYLLQSDSARIAGVQASQVYTQINIGALYLLHSNDPEKALEYYFKALEAVLKSNNRPLERTCYQNIGVAYTNLKQYNQAIEYLTKANTINQELGDWSAISRYYTSIGEIYEAQDQIDLTIENYQQAQEVFPEGGTPRELMFTHLNLARAYLQKGDSVEASWLKKCVAEGLIAYRLADEEGLLNNKSECAGILFQAYKGLGKSNEAVVYAQDYINTRDSLLSEEKIQAIADLQGKYEADKKELEIDLLNRQNALNEAKLNESLAKEKQQQIISITVSVGLVLAAILALLLFRSYRAKQQNLETLTEKNQLIEKQNNEREILLKEIHHRVKNNLQVVSSLLEWQTDDIVDEAASQAVEDGQSRVKAMALIHEKLYQNDDIGVIAFEEYTKQLVQQLAFIYAADESIKAEVQGGGYTLDIDTAIPIGLILNELVSNALKYAFSEIQEKALHIQLHQPQTGHYELVVKDNGLGLPEGIDFSQSDTLGLRLVKRLSRQLYGSATYTFEKGAVFTITFQDTAQRKQVS